MKVRPAIASLVTLLVFFASAEEDWYLKDSLGSKTATALSDLKYWTMDGTTPGEGAPQNDDNLIVNGGKQLRMYGVSFTGNSLTIGDAEKSSTVVHDSADLTMPAGSRGLILRNGYWWLNRKTTFTFDGPVSVTSPEGNPFAFVVSDLSHINTTIDFTGTLSGASGCALVLGPRPNQKKSDCASNFVCRVSDLSNYHGTLVVTSNYENAGASWGTRLELGQWATPSDCRVNAGYGATITTKDGGNSTVGSISFGPGSRLQLSGGLGGIGCITASGAVSVPDAPVPVRAEFNLFSETGYRVPILVGSADHAFTEADFVLDARVTGGDYDVTEIGATHLEAVTDEASGTCTLYLVSPGIVSQTGYYNKEDANGDNPVPGSSLTNAAVWTDGVAPYSATECHAYYTQWYLRTLHEPESDYAFPNADHPAESLWLRGGHLRLTVASFSVPKLYVTGSSSIGTTRDAPNRVEVRASRFDLRESDAKNKKLVLNAYVGQTLALKGEIVGSVPIECRGWASGSPQAYYELDGLNTNFTGKILVSQDEVRSGNINLANKYPRLLISDERNLGGRMPEPDPRALTLTHLAQVVLTNADAVTLHDGLNRGIYVQGCGRFLVGEGKTLGIRWPVLLSGKMMKEGAGTLSLGGVMRHESADGEDVVDVPRANSNLFEIVSGTVKIENALALAGVETTVGEAAALKLVLDPENEDICRYGIKNLTASMPFAQEGEGRLRLGIDPGEVAAPAENETVTNALVSVSDAAAEELRKIMPRRLTVWNNRQTRIVETHPEAGVTTFVAETANRGCVLILR